MCGRCMWSYATQERPLLTTAGTTRPGASYMQKDRPQSVKVRPITAIERAPSLSAATRIAFAMADDQNVRLWPCATQTMHSSLQGGQIVYCPGLPQPWQLMVGRVVLAAGSHACASV